MTSLTSTMVDSECLQLVTSEYSKLQSAIDDLGTSINNTLGQQKQDLDRTHEAEMTTLQVEIERLTNEKTRLEDSIATNERACQLEIERDWYKKEALHLDEVLEQTNVRLKELSDRLDESEQVKMWAKSHVEKLTKQKLAFETKLRELGVEDTTALLEKEETNDKENGLVDEEEESSSNTKRSSSDRTNDTIDGVPVETLVAQAVHVASTSVYLGVRDKPDPTVEAIKTMYNANKHDLSPKEMADKIRAIGEVRRNIDKEDVDSSAENDIANEEK